MLYCDGDDHIKQTLLYDIMISSHKLKPNKPSDEFLVSRLETLVVIPTLLLANIIEQQNRFNIKILEERVMLEELERVQRMLIQSTNG